MHDTWGALFHYSGIYCVHFIWEEVDKIINLPFLLPKHFCSDPSAFWEDVCLWHSWSSAHHLHAVWCSFPGHKARDVQKGFLGAWMAIKWGLMSRVTDCWASSELQIPSVRGMCMCVYVCTHVCIYEIEIQGPPKYNIKPRAKAPLFRFQSGTGKKVWKSVRIPKTGPRKTQRIQQSYSCES